MSVMKQPLPEMTRPMSRRAFLALTGTLSLGAATVGISLPAEAVKFDRTLYKVSKSRLGMGTFINMMAFHPSEGEAEEAMGRAFAEIDRLSDIMTRYKRSSHLSHLNAKGNLKDVPPELAEVLRASLHYYDISKGTFDITVKPIVDLYQDNFRVNNSPPSPEALEQALARVGSHHLRITPDSVSFARNGIEVTLDGIAKGYIIDRAMTLLRQQGLQHALINAGGDIVVHGGKGEGKPWKIGIQDPWNRKAQVDVVTLNDGAIATSGNYEVFFDREKLFHHLIRPKSGSSAPETASVTIRAVSCMEADAIATSVYVMGPARGNQFIRQLPFIEGLVINSQGKKMSSSGWKKESGL
jgi:thiamine biosynthesis lipoprotein